MSFYKRKSEKGASLIEYGMLTGLVAVVAIAAVVGVGEEVEATFSTAAGGISVVSDEIEAARAPEPMILEFSAAQATVTPSGGGAIKIDWGDETANASCGQDFTASGPITCAAYPGAGTYQVSITGSFTQYGSPADADKAGLTRVIQWGETGVENLAQAFKGATALTDVPSNLPGTVTNLNQMFDGASNFNDPDVSNWNTGNVNRFTGMFYNAASFNQDLPWDMSSAGSLEQMFRGATSFDGSLSTWQTAQFTNLTQTFTGASNFTGKGLANWDVSLVGEFSSTFANAGNFVEDISGWDVSSATTMASMFNGADSFNIDLKDWDVSSVTSMRQMFKLALAYNQDISSWCVSSIPSEPEEFSQSAHADFENSMTKRPVWGTCPTP